MQSHLTKAAWRQQWRGTLRAFLAQATPVLTGGDRQLPDRRAESFSSAAQGELQRAEAPTIKSQLRLLYKRVHPDLFHGHPAERVGPFIEHDVPYMLYHKRFFDGSDQVYFSTGHISWRKIACESGAGRTVPVRLTFAKLSLNLCHWQVELGMRYSLICILGNRLV